MCYSTMSCPPSLAKENYITVAGPPLMDENQPQVAEPFLSSPELEQGSSLQGGTPGNSSGKHA